MKNTLITIGCLGNKSAYLNIPMEEAVKRYLKNNPEDNKIINKIGFVDKFSFNDEFSTYEAYAN